MLASDPEFEAPERTRPLLIASPTTPTSAVYELQPSGGNPASPTYQDQLFRALLLSEDLGEAVEGVLLTDYGIPNELTQAPYAHEQQINSQDAGTLADGPRDVSLTWRTSLASVVAGRGCHSLTLLVTHEFARAADPARFFCPKDPDDFSTLSWFVVLCEVDATCDMSACPKAADVSEVCGPAEAADP